MGQLQMTGAEIAKRLEDALAPTYAHSFKVIADTSEMVLLEAIAGDAEGLDGQKLDYKVNRKIDYVANETALYMVMYRPLTGWSDQPHAEWRWSMHIGEPIPNEEMTLNDVLAYDGLKLNENAMVEAGMPWVNGSLTVHYPREWMHGRISPDFMNAISYKSLCDIPNALMDIEE